MSKPEEKDQLLVKIRRLDRFFFLLVSILVILAVRPFLEKLPGIQFMTDLFFIAIIISAIYAVHPKRKTAIATLALASPALVMRIIGMVSPKASLLSNLFTFLFLTYALLVIISHIVRQEQISVDLIMGSVCAYLLIGLVWGYTYFFIETASPKSFSLKSESTQDIWPFLYYSYVTLTTVGYGDITPVSSPARSFAFLEAITGQLYLAILIARLVGIHISQNDSKHQTG